MTARACVVLLVAVAVLGTAACDPLERGPRFKAAGAKTPRAGGTLRFAIAEDLSSLDPTHNSYNEGVYYALHPLFDTLFDYEPHGTKIVPRLAASWTESPDGLVYTFTLRPDITYADGTPIVAADFKYSLERALDPELESQMAHYLVDIDGAAAMLGKQATSCSGITVSARGELVIRLVHRNPALLQLLAMPFTTPQRRAYVEAAGDQLRRRPDATGPFILAHWDEGQMLVLVRNPHYYDPARAHLDAIELRENIPRDTQFQMFERGELDAAGRLASPDYLVVIGEPAWAPYVHRSVGMNAYGSRFNVRQKPFDDVRVRRAFNYALDKQHTQRLLNGTGVASHGILPPGMLGRDPDLAPYPHDVAKARALLAEAGYPTGLDVDYTTIDDLDTETVAESLQHDLGEAGVRVHITQMTMAGYSTVVSTPSAPAFSFASWVADYPDPTNFFDALFSTGAITETDSTNNTLYGNPALDALLDDARQELDEGRRAELYRRAERILYDDAPWIWSYHWTTTEVTQPYVRDYEPHPIWGRDFTSVWLDLGPGGERVAR